MKKDLSLTLVGIYYRMTPPEIEKLERRLPIYVLLQREQDNIHDSNAVKVIDDKGMHVGYLSRVVASEIGPRMDAGKFHYTEAELVSINGGEGEIHVTLER